MARKKLLALVVFVIVVAAIVGLRAWRNPELERREQLLRYELRAQQLEHAGRPLLPDEDAELAELRRRVAEGKADKVGR